MTAGDSSGPAAGSVGGPAGTATPAVASAGEDGGLARVETHRLFHQNVASFLQKRLRLLEMQVMGRRDDGNIDVSLENVPPGFCGEGKPELVLDQFEFRCPLAAHAVEGDLGPRCQRRYVDAVGEVARTDDGGLDHSGFAHAVGIEGITRSATS